MELLLSSYLPIFLSFLLFIYMIWKFKINSSNARKCPPGPWKLPILGNLHQLATGPLHRTMSDLAKKHGPVMHLKLGEVSAIVISSREAAREVLKTHDTTFADRPRILFAQTFSYNYINIAFSPYGEYWKELRRICTLELLSAKRVRSYQSVREDEVENLIKTILLSPGVPINLTEMISSLTTDITCRAAFGNKCKDKDAFMSIVKEGGKLAGEFFVPDVLPSFKFLHRISKAKMEVLENMKTRVDYFLDTIIGDHLAKRENGMPDGDEHDEEEDLVDVLLRLQQNSQLEFSIRRDNIKAVILDVFSAGTETSSTAMEWAMSEMIKNPRVMEKAQAEVRSIWKEKGNIHETDIQQMSYLKCVIKETLRLHPSLPLSVPREARESSKISGYEISAKTMVIVNLWDIGRNEKYWMNAECFEPERFDGSQIDFKGTNFEYIPFGAGKRICPGISFSIANIELSLAHLLYHFDWKLPNGMKTEEFDMTEAAGYALERKNPLSLIAIPHTPK